MKTKSLVSVVFVLLASVTFAQTYTEIFQGGLGSGMNYGAPTCCDLDDDGLLDLFVGTQSGYIKHYEQDAVGSTFFPMHSYRFNNIDIGEFSTPCFIDLDNDGLLDMILGEQSGNLYHYEQNSIHSAEFSLLNDRFNNIDVDWGSAPCFTDLDTDGLLDMIVGERYGNLNHYEQDAAGSENFTLVDDSLSAIVAGWRARPTITDLDGDNLLDLVIGDQNGDLLRYEQQAAGSTTFTPITNQLIGTNVGEYTAPFFTDLEGDGILDLIIGEYDGHINHYRQLGPGSSIFSLMTEKLVNGSIDVGAKSAPAAADLDNDGKLDLIVGEEDGNLNHFKQSAAGSPVFHWFSGDFNGIDVGSNSTPCLTDLDGDGLIDLIVGTGSGLLQHYEQNAAGSAAFTEMPDTFDGLDIGSFSAPCFTDLDGDGLMDMIIGEVSGSLFHYEQDAAGAAGFSLVSDHFNGIDVGDLSSPVFTDLDNDDQLDLLVNELSSRLHYYEQDAPHSLNFTLVTDDFNQIQVARGRSVFTDVNGDGLEDLIMGEYLGGLHYFQRNADTYIDESNPELNPSTFDLRQNYPNPFNASTSITYVLPKAENVTISIYNSKGRRVRLLENGSCQAGSHSVAWDGKDEIGNNVSTGIYVCCLQTVGNKDVIKLMVLK